MTPQAEASPAQPAAAPPPAAAPTGPTLNKRWLLCFFLFWSWNLVFLLLVGFFVAPTVLWALLLEVADGLLPPSLLLSATFVVGIPALAALMAAWPLRQQPERWLTLMYGIEGPLFIVGLFRLFALRELTPAAGLVLIFVSLGMLAFGYAFALGVDSGSRRAAILRSLGAGLSLSTAAFLGVLLSFYAVPIAIWLIVRFLRFAWLLELVRILREVHGAALVWMPMALFLFVYSASLLVVLPFAMVWLYAKQGIAVLRSAARFLPRWQVALLVLAVPVAAELAYRSLGQQPQQRIMAQLEPTPDISGSAPTRSDAERRLLLAQRDDIRRGLLNAYLAPYRYLSATGSNDHIRKLFHEGGYLPAGAAEALQQTYNLLVAPFLYQGPSLHADQGRAEQLYESFFDAPIQKAERETILRSLAATYDRDQRQAGLLNIGQRKVHLQRQELAVHEHGDFASIELHEVYENQTVEQQEIFYYFSLPESAVITGLWLGDTDDRSKRFAPNVAPRGAAQRVYNREVQRRADPALLEQVGPRQYRLRAFPIPPRARLSRGPVFSNDRSDTPPILHLWLTYDVLADQGAWPLPALREQRNVYADRHTVRVLNGQPRSLPRDEATAWLPARLPAQAATTAQPHRLHFPAPSGHAGGLDVQIAPETAPPPPLPAGQTFAVVVDRTLSMERHAAALADNLDWIKQQVAGSSRVHVYLSAAAQRGEPATRIDDIAGLDARRIQFFGGHRLGTLLRQFAALRGSQSYRAVLVLTDDGSMDFADDKDAIADFQAPVFFVHVGGSLAAGYDDASIATMQKRGGSAVRSAAEAFQRIAAATVPLPPDTLLSEVIDGYRFTVRRSPEAGDATTPPPSDGAAPAAQPTEAVHSLAARALILALLREVDHGQAGALDRLHAVAKAHSQVSPYSSMIVLVNDEQRRALEQAEREKNRFDRQVESGKEALTSPGDLMVSGVPEPEEWLLILVVGLAALVALRRP